MAFVKARNGRIDLSPELRADLARAKRAIASKTAQPLHVAATKRFLNGQLPRHPGPTSGKFADWSTDAAMSSSGFKMAATHEGKFATRAMTPGSEDALKYLSISHFEIVAVYAGLILFRGHTADAFVRGLCDNAAATACLNTGVARDPAMAVATSAVLDHCATTCLLYTSPSPRDQRGSRMPSSA